MNWFWLFLLMGSLLCLSGLFSGSETALFSLSREDVKRIEAEGTRTGRLIAGLVSSPKELLITLLFGNSVVNVAFFSLSYGLSQWVLQHHAHGTFWATVTGITSLLIIIIFGEVIPKGIAVKIPERLVYYVAFPIYVIDKIFLPFKIPLVGIVDGIGWVLGWRPRHEPYVTMEELKVMLSLGEKHGAVEPKARSMIHAVLDFGRMKVRDLMVPRVDMMVFDISRPVEEFVSLVRRSVYKKVPVFEGTSDNILGVVYAKDVFLNPGTKLRELVKPILFVPESKNIESLLREFRREHQQMAIVVDEYGGTAGLITLEDILEEVVGEIHDETERPEEPIRKVADNRYVVHGSLSLRDWSETFGIELESDEADTVGGFVVSLLGRIPQKEDSVSYQNIVFIVDEVKRRRITRLLIEFREE
ncbi:MAG: hemolysin family protein [Candidatus Brocadiales bacterium]